jgi:crossover junction endodeoxyribonuclease RusA
MTARKTRRPPAVSPAPVGWAAAPFCPPAGAAATPGTSSPSPVGGGVPGPGLGTPAAAQTGPHGAGVPSRTWTLELPAGLKVLTLNDRLHWAEEHRRRQALKKAAWVMALNAKIPHLPRAVVSLEYQPPDLRERDEDNMAATAKPCIDGLVAAKVFTKDSSEYVSYGGCTISKRLYPKGRVIVTITDENDCNRDVAGGAAEGATT